MSPTGKLYSFRSCVRASEAACARGTLLLPWLGPGTSNSPPRGRARPRAPPLAALLFELIRAMPLQIAAKRC